MWDFHRSEDVELDGNILRCPVASHSWRKGIRKSGILEQYMVTISLANRKGRKNPVSTFDMYTYKCECRAPKSVKLCCHIACLLMSNF